MNWEKFQAWATATRCRRLLVAVTGPIWLPVAMVVAIPCLLAHAAWEGDPGKLIRWIWKGKAD